MPSEHVTRCLCAGFWYDLGQAGKRLDILLDGRCAAGSPGGVARRACLQRYRAKKARRLFTHTVRYAARKANADRRPRVKGRFVKASELAAYLQGQE